MRKTTKSAFTLVELIVVITILAVLGTIAFISLQGYSADARNTKRTSDIGSIQSAISTKMAEGVSLMAFVGNSGSRLTTAPKLAGTGSTTTNYEAGTPNYTALGVKAGDFQDPNGQDYPIGATTTAGGRYEIAASLETDGTREALIKGTYVSRSDDTVTVTGLGKIITLANEDTHKFRTGDTVSLTIGGTPTTAVIKKVAKDGVTLTFSVDVDGATDLKLAFAETGGLIGQRSDQAAFVVNGNTVAENQPY